MAYFTVTQSRNTDRPHTLVQILTQKRCNCCSNAVAESFMLRVLPSALPRLGTQFTCCTSTKVQILTQNARLESQRQALLLARFTTMLTIFNGCSAWKVCVGCYNFFFPPTDREKISIYCVLGPELICLLS